MSTKNTQVLKPNKQSKKMCTIKKGSELTEVC